MKLRVKHETVYTFNKEVFFEPHFLRFKPRNSPHIEINNFKLDITPLPAGISEHVDTENNPVHLCWFENLHKTMLIKSDLTIISVEHNPFNFIIHPQDYLTVPFKYDENSSAILKPSLEAEYLNAELIKYAESILLRSNSKTVDFLVNLTRQIHADFSVETREHGNPYEAIDTFTLKKGSCRDLAWMQIMLLRHFGFAARFVSGYYFLNIAGAEFELHAWVEVFLPGAGWIGFDPSHGIIAGNSHIPVASSAFSENTMPVSGTIRGDGVSSLKTELKIEIQYQ